MERMTATEWIAVEIALGHYVETCWESAVKAYDRGGIDAGDYFANRVLVAKSAYDKALDWSWEADRDDKPESQESYEPVYQEPDSFFTQEELDT